MLLNRFMDSNCRIFRLFGAIYQEQFRFLVLFYFSLISPAERVTSNLKELAQQVAPGDVVSTYGIRKAMGISIPLGETLDSSVDLTEGE